jgi:hypothetical protein
VASTNPYWFTPSRSDRAPQPHQPDNALWGAWNDLDGEQRRILSAVTYLARTDDEEDDLQSPIGFEDDVDVVAAAIRRIRQLAEARTGSVRPST